MVEGSGRQTLPRLTMHATAVERVAGTARLTLPKLTMGTPSVVIGADPLPAITMKAILDFGEATDDGQLVRAVTFPWFEIVKFINEKPESIYQINWRKWEEIIAAAYDQAGFDEVVLTPRSGDRGRDIVATKNGIGSIRIFDQVKAYKPGRVVTADEVRAMLGVITGARNVSKGIITTTSDFAPRIETDERIAPLLPTRLELKPRDALLDWLASMAKGPDK